MKTDLRFDDYHRALFQSTIVPVTQRTIRSTKHETHSIMQNRIGLNPVDMKRWVHDDGVTTLAYGHKAIPKKASK